MTNRLNGALLAYSVLTTTALAAIMATQAISGPSRASFDEIDVRRINLREDDGTLRMVISNTSHFPGLIIRGKEHPHPTRRTAGMLFFNEEGTENGGLIFSGRSENGHVRSSGHLSFDQYEQDQVVQITHSEADGRRWAGLVVSDRPDEPLDMEWANRVQAMPDGPEKEAELRKLRERYGGAQRVFVGKTQQKTSEIGLFDAAGRPRIRLVVTPEGEASIQFLDESGKPTRTISAKDAAG